MNIMTPDHHHVLQGKSYKEQNLSHIEVTRVSFVPECFENVHQILGMKVEPGTADSIKKELEKSPEVAAVYIALGDYDIIALLNIEDPEELTHFVVERVRKMKGVLDTQTILIKK